MIIRKSLDLNHYNIYRSTTYGFIVNTETDTPVVTQTINSDSGLTASTTYYYVAAVNNSRIIAAVSTQASPGTGPPQIALTVTAASSTD